MSVNNSTLCHNWAHQTKAEQRGSNMSFDEFGRLYSYSTVIGQRLVLDSGEIIYVINEGSYSNTTNRHQGEMRSAIPVDAKKFPVEDDVFHYQWSGLLSPWGKFDKKEMIRFVMIYCRHLYESLQDFKDSKSLDIGEARRPYRIWRNIVDWCDTTKCTTIKQLLKISADEWFNKCIWRYRSSTKNDAVRVKAVLKVFLNKASISEIVDIACGAGTYDAYVKRTSGLRKAQSTRIINKKLGFDVNAGHFHKYYDAYPRSWTAPHKNEQYVQLSGRVKEGKLTSAQLEKMRKSDDYIKQLLAIKRKNFEYNMAAHECDCRNYRRSRSKERLELYIGYNWKIKKRQFIHNGVTIDLTHCNSTRMPDREYIAFCKMTKGEQREFIKRERAALFLKYTNEIREYEDRMMRRELESRARKEEAERLEALQIEKKQYIESKKGEGTRGYIQLWREGLVSNYEISGRGLLRGGNALLKYDKKNNIVQTSKGIFVSVEECKRLWNLISRWHKNATSFISDKVKGTSTSWTITRYENDIMIAGCHAISYAEMEDLAKTLEFI